MKIAVTAANGQLGQAIVEELKKEIGTENIVGIARTPEKAQSLGTEIRKGDYNHGADFDRALKGVDTLLLVSGRDEPQKRIQQHRNVIEAARQNGVQTIVYTSIIGDENKTAFSPVVKSNRQTEKIFNYPVFNGLSAEMGSTSNRTLNISTTTLKMVKLEIVPVRVNVAIPPGLNWAMLMPKCLLKKT